MTDKTQMCVTYASDDNYAKFLGISMLSLFEHNKGASRIDVFILDSGIGPDNRGKLESIAGGYGRSVIFMPVDDKIGSLSLNMGARKISVVSYARLFISSLLPVEYDRTLYLDCDTLVLDDLSGIFETDMGDSLVAGVQDTVDSFFLKAIGLEKGCRYVNAGILLLNIAAWRREKLGDDFLKFIDKFGGNVPHHDQGVINGVCGERRTILPLRYNVTTNIYSLTSDMIKVMYDLDEFYSGEEVLAARKKPAIVHFTSGFTGRPWEEGCTHPMKENFVQMSKLSPWPDEPMQPNTLKAPVRIMAGLLKLLPGRVFAALYRSTCWITHQRK